MIYPFMTLDDDTEIVHSEMKSDGKVMVYIEKPDEKVCFHSAVCWLPEYKWEDIYGFSEEDIKRYEKVIRSTAHLINEEINNRHSIIQHSTFNTQHCSQ